MHHLGAVTVTEQHFYFTAVPSSQATYFGSRILAQPPRHPALPGIDDLHQITALELAISRQDATRQQ